MEEIVFYLVFIAILNLTLGICGIVVDYVLPHYEWFNKWLESLPDYEENEQ